MTKKDPRANLRPWKPGQSGNPAGKPKGILTADKYKQLVDRYWQMPLVEIQAALANPTLSAGEHMVASVISHAIESGDTTRIEALLSRVIGKVKDEKDHNMNFNVSLRGMPREDVIEIGKDALRYLQDGDGDAD